MVMIMSSHSGPNAFSNDQPGDAKRPAPSPLADGKTHILMCPPAYFEVTYVINPWMEQGTVDTTLAKQQWNDLFNTLSQLPNTEVHPMTPVEGLPDLVFTANAAFVVGKTAIIASFKHPERQPESAYYKAWFDHHGFDTIDMPTNLVFEGAGDALIYQNGDTRIALAGYRTRTDIEAHTLISQHTGLPVVSLELANPKFYHIDVCICPLNRGYFLYYPGAFDAYGQQVIEHNIPADKRIVVTADEAAQFACNAVNVGDTVVFNRQKTFRLKDALTERGFTVQDVDLSEFIKAGGSSKCLTLKV